MKCKFIVENLGNKCTNIQLYLNKVTELLSSQCQLIIAPHIVKEEMLEIVLTHNFTGSFRILSNFQYGLVCELVVSVRIVRFCNCLSL